MFYSKVFIDSNGDAEGNYTVVSMLPFHGKRTEASTVDETMNYVMQPVGYFQYNATSTSPNDLPVRFRDCPSLENHFYLGNLIRGSKRPFLVLFIYLFIFCYDFYFQVFRYFNQSRPIDWLGTHPPIPEPHCGFDGKKCNGSEPDWRSFVICTVSGVVLIVAIGLVSRY